MRSDKITFADITEIYNQLDKDLIQQTIMSRRIRRIIGNIDCEGFKKFLKDKNLKDEVEFFNEAIEPLIENKTKISYKSFCLIYIFLLVEESSSKNVVRNVLKGTVSGDEYIDLYFNKFMKNVDYDFSKVIKIACEKFKDTPTNKKILMRVKLLKNKKLKEIRENEILNNMQIDKEIFMNLLNQARQISSKIIIEYSKFIDEKSKRIDNGLDNLTNKILNMNYKSKCRLKIIIEREIKKEYFRFEADKNSSELDKAINKVAMRKEINFKEVERLREVEQYSFLKAMEILESD